MKDPIKGLKAVIFDLDGVVVNSMPFHAKAWQDTFRKFGMRVTKKEIYLREGEKWDKTFFDIMRKKGKRVTQKIKDEVFSYREKVFNDMPKIRPFKEAPPLLRRLKRSGLRLGLVTGTPRAEIREMLPSPLYRLFDVIVPSDEVRRGKPHPEPFRKALKRLGAKPEEAVVIENAPNGIRAAKRAKIRVIAVETSLSRKHLKEADMVVRSLSKLNEQKVL
jgi:beta-phosphoglucomutase